MKKKIVIFLLAVFLVFALLVSALCFFAPQKNQNSRENTTEQQKTEDAAEQTEKEKREHSEQACLQRKVPFFLFMAKPYMSKMSYEVAESIEDAILRMARVN